MNTNVKIFVKAITSHLLDILPSLIKKNDQLSIIKNRQAPDGTRRFINIISALKENKKPCLLLSLDAEKAFDRIHLEYLNLTLAKFGVSHFILKATVSYPYILIHRLKPLLERLYPMLSI